MQTDLEKSDILSVFERSSHKPRIMITGETAGTGASTTSRLLAEQLDLPIISGGKYFRTLANHFAIFQKENSNWSLNKQYQSFLEMYQRAFDDNEVDSLMEKGTVDMVKGDVLANFQEAIEENYRRTNQTDKVWDYIVDGKTISDALQKPGFIWESKLAILALELD